MKKLFIILTLWGLSLFFMHKPFASPCADIILNPAINYSTSYGRLNYDFSKNNRQITQIAQTYGIIERGLFAAGLATVNVNWEISINTLGQIIDDYNICVIPTAVNVFIGYNQPQIYISKDLEKDSCEYNVVLRHEQTHQQINKSALDYFLPRIKKQINQIISQTGPVPVNSITDIDKATIELTQTYNQKIAPLINEFKNELLHEQSKLDNFNNYEHESELCQ